MKEKTLGSVARFLLPSIKLRTYKIKGRIAESYVHETLLKNFEGYTVAEGNIYGYWKTKGHLSYNEHREYRVSIRSRAGSSVTILKKFLARLARELDEDSVYVEISPGAFLISGR